MCMYGMGEMQCIGMDECTSEYSTTMRYAAIYAPNYFSQNSDAHRNSVVDKNDDSKRCYDRILNHWEMSDYASIRELVLVYKMLGKRRSLKHWVIAEGGRVTSDGVAPMNWGGGLGSRITAETRNLHMKI